MLGRTLLTISAVAAMAVLSTAGATAVERPDDQDAGATVTSYLHTVSPTAISPGDRLRLAGTVENTGDEPLANVQALPRWSHVQLETRDEISRVATDESLRWGLRRDDPFQIVAERLEPGEQREFELLLSADEMGFGLAGVYAVGVDIRGSLANGDRVTLDTSRTVLPWFPDESLFSGEAGEQPDESLFSGEAGEQPDERPPTVPMSLLWPVEAPPSLLPDGALRDEEMAERLADDGSLDAILEAVGTKPVSWVLDPDVRDTVNAMTAGYSTGTDPDDRNAGEGAELAATWQSALSDAISDSRPFLLPYARPDVEGLLATDPELAGQLTLAAVEATSNTARTMGSVRTGVAHPGGTDVSDEVLTVLADSGIRTVILSGSAVSSAPDHPLARMSTASGDMDVVLTDPGLDSALADAYAARSGSAGRLPASPETHGSAVAELRQRWTAETAMVALDAAALGVQPEPLVVTPPQRWTPDHHFAAAVVDAWTSIPWVSATPIADLEPPSRPATVTVADVGTANTLPEENVMATGELRQAVHDYTDLLAEPDPGLTTELELATLRSASTGWRDDPAAGVEYTSTITDELTSQLDEVEVTVPESVTLSSRTGVFPLTVTNDLDRPVTVKLDITSANPDRLRIGGTEEQRVEPGARETVEVRAEAATNGRVPITVRLVTSDGSPLGPTTHTVVNATDYGTIGWVIIAGATAVFGASVLRTTLRRRRGHKRGGTGPSEEAPMEGGSADELAAHVQGARP